MHLLVHSFLLVIGIARTVIAYGPHVQHPHGMMTAISASYSTAATNNDIIPPSSIPTPSPPSTFPIQLQAGALPGLSVPQQDPFGFSVEFNAVTTVLGLNSSSLPVSFLNSIVNIRERAGCLGDNSQGYVALVNPILDGSALDKYYGDSTDLTETLPAVFISEDMTQVSSLGDVCWYLGIPFNDTQSWRLQFVDVEESVLGDCLVGFQGGNESDLYLRDDYWRYKNEQPTRVAVMTIVNDNSGTSNYTASMSINGMVPSQVRVEYFSTSSVMEECNITWAGQTFGDDFASDGRPVGILDVQTNHVCNIQVPAPGAALVFLTNQAPSESDPGPTMAVLTTACTTSNGNKGLTDSLANQGGAISGASGLGYALSSIGVLIAVCTFVCLESLLTYAVTGSSPLGLVLNATKNAR